MATVVKPNPRFVREVEALVEQYVPVNEGEVTLTAASFDAANKWEQEIYAADPTGGQPSSY